MTQVVLNLIATYSMMYGVDPNLAAAVIAHESKFNVEAVGEIGEIGLMQLRPEYFAASCKGNSVSKPTPKSIVCGRELFSPELNIKIGIQHLADLKKRCPHRKDNTYIVCHNVGVVGGGRLKNPKAFSYYKKVMAEYTKIQDKNLFNQELDLLTNAFKPTSASKVAIEY